MTESEQIDPERLAALIDGRLGDADAAAVRRQLGLADDDTLSAFADAIAVTRDLEASGAVPRSGPAAKTIPLRTASRRRRWMIPAVSAAVAAVVTIVVRNPGASADFYAPARFADGIPANATTLAGPAWSGTRGAGDGLLDRPRAVRIGALLTDLELDAIRGRLSRDHVAALTALLESTPGAGSVVASLTAIAGDSSPRDVRKQLADVGRQSIAVTDSVFTVAGAYLEAARLATASGDTTFFDRVPPIALQRLSREPTLASSASSEVSAVLARAQSRPRDAAALSAAVNQLLRTLAE